MSALLVAPDLDPFAFRFAVEIIALQQGEVDYCGKTQLQNAIIQRNLATVSSTRTRQLDESTLRIRGSRPWQPNKNSQNS